MTINKFNLNKKDGIYLFLIIIFLMNCGVISIIPVFALSSEEKESYIAQVEKEIKSEGYQVAKIIQNQEITDWKAGDSLKEKVGRLQVLYGLF
ncbi:hypothetical protein, partial [Methanobrevibacter sp.]